VVTASGDYYVTVTDSIGCSSTDTINVNFSNGVKESVGAGFDVNVYPNPTNDKTFNINFEVAEKANIEVRIMNGLGMVVFQDKSKEFTGTYNNRISLTNLAAGMYFAEIRKGNSRSIVKVSLK
jgi:hypothetical protein